MLSQSEQIANLERQVRELDERYRKALVELNRFRSENTTLKLMLDGADVVERSLQQRNRMQSETIERYRDELADRTHGYKS